MARTDLVFDTGEIDIPKPGKMVQEVKISCNTCGKIITWKIEEHDSKKIMACNRCKSENIKVLYISRPFVVHEKY